jgi:transcriptional regulator with XRE-family HTH domain
VLPYYRWQLTAAKPIPGYPAEIRHIGHELLKRRLDLGLQQRDAARSLGVHPGCLENWEYGRKKPADRFYPAIIRFLGFNPLTEAVSLGGSIRRERISRGWSRARLASIASVDEATVARLERNVPRTARRPTDRVLRALMLIP